ATTLATLVRTSLYGAEPAMTACIGPDATRARIPSGSKPTAPSRAVRHCRRQPIRAAIFATLPRSRSGDQVPRSHSLETGPLLIYGGTVAPVITPTCAGPAAAGRRTRCLAVLETILIATIGHCSSLLKACEKG